MKNTSFKLLTTQEFIEKCKKVHGDKYGYEKTTYLGAKKRVEITCLTHGAFMQLPYDHLNNKGCLQCAIEVRAAKATQRKHDPQRSEKYFNRVKKSHGDRYDYSLAVYNGTNEKIKIICKIHGVFEQKAEKHASGSNCPRCMAILRGQRMYLNKYCVALTDINDFIVKAKKVHGEKYDYSAVVYTLSREKVEIICNTHGCFLQKAALHIQGRGCPRCGIEKFLSARKRAIMERKEKKLLTQNNSEIRR